MTESSCHPWTVYGLLRQLIGELSSFSEQFAVSGDAVDGSGELPKYYHLNLRHCFSRAQSVITALLTRSLQDRNMYSRFPMTAHTIHQSCLLQSSRAGTGSSWWSDR